MTNNIVEEISKIMEEECKKETNIFSYDIWTYHILRVVKYAKMLAVGLGADDEIVEIAALLHDYASIKDAALKEEHHLYGAMEAEKILRNLNYPEDKINHVKECIIQHRGSVLMDKTSRESICVASADAMAHIEQMPSLLKLAYREKNLSVEDGANWVMEKIQRSWNKLCPEAKEIMNHKYYCAIEILSSYKK